MADAAQTEVQAGAPAAAALAFLTEMSPGLRGAAILDAEGSALAASGEDERWAAEGKRLLDAAAAAGSEPVERIHVATEAGEVFALRHAGLTAIAVSDRFVLSSLMLFDMRQALRELAGAS